MENSWRKKPADELGQKLVFFKCWKMGHITIRCLDRAERKAFTAQMRNKSDHAVEYHGGLVYPRKEAT